ncbi:recombinase family protein [Clostridium tertium]|uniref:recombinase family protein n=1 Tax=Clostridium tertium TaxID=1559 RepID=UPI0020282D8F|nr:recombinase family protein [Clostridium tertium]
MIYGYARVSTVGQKDGNSLEAQERALREAGATEIYSESYTGTKKDRPVLNELLAKLKTGDTLSVTKLDRMARSAIAGAEIVQELIDRGIKVYILNMGMLDNTPASKLVRQIFFAFAEFERDMIVERTSEGKEIARAKAEAKGEKFKEGRPKKYSKAQLDHAIELRKEYSIKQVSEMTGISEATIKREQARRKAEGV